MMKPVDQTKKDVRPSKESAPKFPVEKNKPTVDSKSILVVNYPEKYNTSPNATKVTQNGKLPPKNDKISMLLCPTLFITLITIL